MPGGSEFLDPIANPQAWDVIIVGDITSPGVCKLSEVKRKHEWDVKKGKGTKGGTVTYVGTPPATFSVTVRIWDNSELGGENQFAAWAQFIQALKYDPTKKQPQAVDIYHPALADVDITSVVCESIGQLEPVAFEGTQYYEAVLDFIEYAPPPPKPAVGTPTGSQGQVVVVTGKTQTGNGPQSDEQTLAALQQQLQQAQQALP